MSYYTIQKLSLRLSLGSFNGTLSKLKASDLGSVVIKEALHRANVEAQQVNEVIMGQVKFSYQIKSNKYIVK